MKRITEIDLNTQPYWDKVYKDEYRSAKCRYDDERRDFLYGAIRDWWQFMPQYHSPAILDAGCGEGQMLRLVHVLFPSWRKFGIDIATDTITRNQEDDPGFKYQAASVYQLPFPEDYFSVVHCGETLEHLEYPIAAIKEMARVIHPGGNLILSVPFEGANPSDEHMWEFKIEDAISLTAPYGELRNLRVVAGGLSIMWSTKLTPAV